MKTTISILFAVLLFTACGNASKTNSSATAEPAQQTEAVDNALVNVYYFHGKQRCKTCLAVEDVAKKTITEAYANNQQVKFVEVNTEDKANEALVEKYEVTWNALIVAKGEDKVDITESAFANAVNTPDALIGQLKDEVNKRLN